MEKEIDVDGVPVETESTPKETETVLRGTMVVFASAAVALSLATVFVPTAGRTTFIECFLLGSLLAPNDLGHPTITVGSTLSVLVFLVAVFQPRADTPSVNTNYISGALCIVVMFVSVTWSALASAATGPENETPDELSQWMSLACPLAACFLVAYGDSQRVGVHASAFVFARCCRYLVWSTPKQPRTIGGVFFIVGVAYPLVVGLVSGGVSFVDTGLLVLAALHVVIQLISAFWLP